MCNTKQFSTQAIRKLVLVSVLLGMLSFVGCGGAAAPATQNNDQGPKFNSPPPSSNVQLKIGDAPSERIIALKLNLKTIQATPTSGSKVSLLASPVAVEVTHLAASNQLLAEITMPQTSYKQLAVTYSGATVTYLDATTNQPVQKTFSTVSASTVNISPAFKIVAGGNVLNLDVDVAKTVNLDLVKKTVTLNAPVIKVSAQAVGSTGEQLPETGAVEHITGKVSSVSGIAFTIKSGQSGQAVTFGTDQNTVFVGTSIDSMSGLIVTVEAESLADGTLLATEVDNVNTGTGVSVDGLITGYTGWGYFNVVMQDGTGSGMTDAMLGANLALALDTTTYTFNSNDVDMTGLPFTFDENSMVPGQHILIDSANSVQPDPQGVAAGFVTATTVELQKQTVNGTVSNYVNNGDGTATFDLTLASDGNSYLSATNPGVTGIEVHTSAKTAVNVAGSLNGKTIHARGFLFFYDPTAFSVHGSRNLKGYIGGGQGSGPYFAMAASQISQ